MKTPSKKGFALIVVLSFVVLVAAVLVAFMMSVTTERASSSGYAASISARRLGDMAVALVQTQINSAAISSTNGLAWVSQPGMVRTFDSTGSLSQAYKLYSAPKMIAPTVTSTTDNPASGGRGSVAWDKKPALWVDLNAPIIAAGVTNYPIFDPAVLLPISNTFATGTPKTGAPTQILGLGGSGIQVTGVPVATGTSPNPAPMPVQWLYVLADGSVIVPDANSTGSTATFNNADTKETTANPIVGRIAFWTDDETCKVNINTASAGITTGSAVTKGVSSPYTDGTVCVGAYWDVPHTFTQTEVEGFALKQPARHEYQRFPGHPATVSLAALFPVDFTKVDPMQYAELLYQITPRIAGEADNPNQIYLGSNEYWTSVGGTQIPKASDPKVSTTGIRSDGDRLFTSVDEMMFSGTGNRVPNGIINKAVIDSRRFLLTAHSRAPETNLFGLPRIATWPIHITGLDSTGNPYALGSGTDYTNVYDRTIGFCSSTGTVNTASFLPYYFQRQKALSGTNDWVNIPRNQQLYSYLKYLTGNSTAIPGFGGNFATKYASSGTTPGLGTDLEFILTGMFDYIRCLNLNDDTLTSSTNQFTGAMVGYQRGYTVPSQDPWGHSGGIVNMTLTSGSTAGGNNNGGYVGDSGCGVVAPIKVSTTPIVTTTGTTLGQGRFFTLKQLTLVFICNADGDLFPAPTTGTTGTGMNVITKTIVTGTSDDKSVTYSYAQTTGSEVSTGTAINCNNPNVNWCLEGTACTGTLGGTTGQANIQMAVIPEFASTTPGWRAYVPNMRVRIAGLDQFKLSGSSLCLPKDSDASPSYIRVTAEDGDTSGNLSPALALVGHIVTKDMAYNTSFPYAWNKPNGITSGTTTFRSAKCPIYPWVSKCIKVQKQANGLGLNFTGGDITVSIYADALNPELVQQIKMTVGPINNGPIPKPYLGATGTAAATAFYDPSYFTFFSDGFGNPVTLKGGAVVQGHTTIDGTGYNTYTVTLSGTAAGLAGSDYGRCTVRNNPEWAAVLTGTGPTSEALGTNTPVWYCPRDPGYNANHIVWWDDVVKSMVPNYTSNPFFDYRIIAARPLSSGDYSTHTFYSGTKTLATLGLSYTTFDANKPIVLGGSTSAGSSAYAMLTQALPDNFASSGDFDLPQGTRAEGAFINKADEGDYYRVAGGGGLQWTDGNTFPYYSSRSISKAAGPTFFSPNRIMPSPVLFGSLPACVASGTSWRTLLFRPDSTGTHGGATAPKDHLLLDLFWMPVVEPYAISDRFSTAGKINMNYQIIPFTYITRDAAMRAVLAPERVQIIPTKINNGYLHPSINGDANSVYGSTTAADAIKYGPETHWPIDIGNTLDQFNNWFSSGKVFISPSQICDIHMVPKDGSGVTWSMMQAPSIWWGNNAMTADNLRERIYATVYPKLTTKSNTFTVHCRVQSLKKAPKSAAGTWKEGVDAITGEYRGSTMIERFINPNPSPDNPIPDYATNPSAPSLENYYKWRVIQNTQFTP